MANSKVTTKLDERKSGFISDLKSVLGNPREKLFTGGELDTEKFSTFLNNYVNAYLQETVKECNFTAEQIPQVEVQDLITTPPGDSTGSKSFGNYNVNLNFIEVNKNRFRPEMSDSELSRGIITALTGVAHEFRHFVQSAYTYNGVPESKVVSSRREADNISEIHHENRISLNQDQIDGLKKTLGGSEKADSIKEDMLYGYGNMGLISVAEQCQDQTSAFADGNKAAKKFSILGNNDNRAPIIQAYYYNLAHEVDARNSAPSVVFDVAKDCGMLSNSFLKLTKESLQQFINAKIDNNKQPKSALNEFIRTACGNKKGDSGITPEMIEKYFNMNAADLKIPKSDQREYVEGSIMTLLHHMPQEKIDGFIESLKSTSIDPSLIDKAVGKNISREASVVSVSKEEIIEARPYNREEQIKETHQRHQIEKSVKSNEISLNELENRDLE